MFPRLKERRHQKAGTFSGGEQQMLAIARGLMSMPEMLIIDELSLGLAPVVVQQLVETLKALKAEGVTVLLVEQNVHLALALSDYAYVIAEGRPFAKARAPRSRPCRKSGKPIWGCEATSASPHLPAAVPKLHLRSRVRGVPRVLPVQTAMRNCMRDEEGPLYGVSLVRDSKLAPWNSCFFAFVFAVVESMRRAIAHKHVEAQGNRRHTA